MSLPESLTYGGSTAAFAGITNPVALNKATYGRYVSASNLLDERVSMQVFQDLRKDNVLDTWIRFERFRNERVNSQVVPGGKDRNLSVQIRSLAPITVQTPADGSFTQQEVLDHLRGMASILLTTDFLDRVVRGEL